MGKDNEPLLRLGLALKTRRSELGITQYELADRCRMQRSFIAGVENGRRNVSILTLRRITEQLETTMEKIFRKARL